MSALASRDPFARTELYRTRVSVRAESCAYCGQRRRTLGAYTTPTHYWLYRFRVETDGGRVYEDRQLFCSRACRDQWERAFADVAQAFGLTVPEVGA